MSKKSLIIKKIWRVGSLKVRLTSLNSSLKINHLKYFLRFVRRFLKILKRRILWSFRILIIMRTGYRKWLISSKKLCRNILNKKKKFWILNKNWIKWQLNNNNLNSSTTKTFIPTRILTPASSTTPVKTVILKTIKMTETVPIQKLLGKTKPNRKSKWLEVMKDNLKVGVVDHINLVNNKDLVIFKRKCDRIGVWWEEQRKEVLSEVITVQSSWAWCSNSIKIKSSP